MGEQKNEHPRKIHAMKNARRLATLVCAALLSVTAGAVVVAPIPLVRDCAYGCDAVSLLESNAALDGWIPSPGDIDSVARADVYVTLGFAAEKRMIDAAKTRNARLQVFCPFDGCRRIAGNPYVWADEVNLGRMRNNMSVRFTGRALPGCIVLPETSLRCAKRIGNGKYTVGIAHRAFEYQCSLCGADTVLVDPSDLAPGGDGLCERIAELRRRGIGLLFVLPQQKGSIAAKALKEAGIAVYAEADALGGNEVDYMKISLAMERYLEETAYGEPDRESLEERSK